MRVFWSPEIQRFTIAKGVPARRRYFSFFVDGKPSWTKYPYSARTYKTDSEAYAELEEMRKVARERKRDQCAPAQNPQGTQGGEK